MTPVHSKIASAPPASLGGESKSALKAMFITLFIDLVGFSIIFPLFPNMLTHYFAQEGTTGFLGSILSNIDWLSALMGGADNHGRVVLFGGLLGSVYSLLQFACAPLIGSLSDRYGRKPVLLVSIFGLIVSYVLWFFAGNFMILVVARIIGGIMSGNISTASAVVADVTSPSNRSKGMALIGVAFGLGFIFGPAIGGFSALFDLTAHWPVLAQYGVNPFSFPALIAALLATVNLVFVLFRFRETLPPDRRGRAGTLRTNNPLQLFKTEAYPGVTRTNLAYFLFITAFSGMEFSLTFVGVERFENSPKDNAYMLLFIGIVLALVQGGYVRRKSETIGARQMGLHGLLATIPGLFLVGYAQTRPLMYLGLLFMAIGTAQVIPCMTALVSLYAPLQDQGRILGIFRSLGALARAVGPLVGCVLYWRLGSATAYYLAGGFMMLPLIVASKLPKPVEN